MTYEYPTRRRRRFAWRTPLPWSYQMTVLAAVAALAVVAVLAAALFWLHAGSTNRADTARPPAVTAAPAPATGVPPPAPETTTGRAPPPATPPRGR